MVGYFTHIWYFISHEAQDLLLQFPSYMLYAHNNRPVFLGHVHNLTHPVDHLRHLNALSLAVASAIQSVAAARIR